MTITRAKSSGWAANDVFTSAQANALDTNITKGLDKTSDGDTLSGAIQLSGAGRIIPSVKQVAGDTTISVGSFNFYRITSSTNFNLNLALSSTGAQNGDVITFFADSDYSKTAYVRDSTLSGTILYEIGNYDAADGPWASFIFLGGWRLFNRSQGSTMRTVEFTQSGNWTCPRGVTKILAFGYGGGGAGGAGANTSAGGSGAGGGGSMASWVNTPVTPGNVYTIFVGGGGTYGTNSGNGSDTQLYNSSTSSIVARYPAGLGGATGSSTSYTTSGAGPGIPYQFFDSKKSSFISYTEYTAGYTRVPHSGGIGSSYSGQTLYPADSGAMGFGVGSAIYYGGLAGANSGSYGGGGGGGAGPGGNGANGGAYVTAGSNAADNTGAGGGGAGTGFGSYFAGGKGGSGKLVIYYVK